LSRSLRWPIRNSPISIVDISRSGESLTRDSTWFTNSDSFPMLTGRFSHAFRRPESTFWRSNFSRLPSFLITIYGTSSIRSYVVYRRSHAMHSLRRRIASPSLLSRESTTLSSKLLQNGHFMLMWFRNAQGLLPRVVLPSQSLRLCQQSHLPGQLLTM